MHRMFPFSEKLGCVQCFWLKVCIIIREADQRPSGIAGPNAYVALSGGRWRHMLRYRMVSPEKVFTTGSTGSPLPSATTISSGSTVCWRRHSGSFLRSSGPSFVAMIRETLQAV